MPYKANKIKRIWQLLFVLIWCAQMLTAVYFCYQKKGFHEDEYYTYYSTARTYGLNIENNAWMEHDAYFNEFVVLEGERFQYGLVKQVQSWDVHPPVYYWIFHTIASLFPGKFSKWYGLVLNLAAFGISMVLLWILSLKVTKYNEKLSLLVCLFYGFTPVVISSVVFIRMYALLTVFVLMCAVLHVRVIEDYTGSYVGLSDKLSTGSSDGSIKLSVWRFLLPLAVVTYFGFLTQYYYFIFLFFIGFAFCVYMLWKDRNLWNCIRYAVSLAVAFGLAYVTYPSCLGQMFRGQRGAQATGNFFDVSNTLMRLEFFYELMDEYVFGKLLAVLVLVVVLLGLYVWFETRVIKYKNIRNNDNGEKKLSDHIGIRYDEYFILLFAVVGYFFVVSKTALLLGETSIRYQMPIYGMVVLLIFAAIDGLVRGCVRYSGKGSAEWIRRINYMNGRIYNVIIGLAALVAVIINIIGFVGGRVVFLYPEDEERIAFAKGQQLNKTPVVYIYDENQSWCVWDVADELFEYDRVYFMGQGGNELIDDVDVVGSDAVVVYLNNTAQAEEELGRIMSGNANLSDYELKYQEKYCDVYYLYGRD
ncbi:MAG: glycosyltransferase family 39 protein [Lachnospiraceae bacterium]|nr:glycosyltransferase family 39 protein [Lachnospiraceae bacterium]